MSDTPVISYVTAFLQERDGSIIDRVRIERNWFEPPMIVVRGEEFFLRTSADAVADPLHFVRERRVYRGDTTPI
jgi:hypothetical protein